MAGDSFDIFQEQQDLLPTVKYYPTRNQIQPEKRNKANIIVKNY